VLSITFKARLTSTIATLALIAAQRHKTTSTSARPLIREQQGLAFGLLIPTCTKPCAKLTQTRNSGQVSGGGATVSALTELRVVKKNKMLRERTRMVTLDATPFEPILQLDVFNMIILVNYFEVLNFYCC
jgi:hypothetical protein